MTIEIRTHYKPGDLGRVIYLHGLLYAQEFKLDRTFESDVAAGMTEFVKQFDGEKDLLAIAEDGDRMVGSVVIMGLPDQTAQLRFFLLTPSARGLGLGTRLLNQAIDFCRQRGFKSISLWTISELKVAAHLYRKAGFTLTEETTRELWGGVRTEQRYDLII